MEIFEAGSTTEGAAGQFKELVHIASERRKDRVDKFIASVDLFSVSKGLDDIDDDIPHTETPAQDEDSLDLAIAFWQRRHQVNSMCAEIQKEQEERRAAAVKKRKTRMTNLGVIAETAAKSGLARWKMVSKAIKAGANFQSTLEDRNSEADGRPGFGKRFKKAVPFSQTTEVSTAKFSLADFMHRTALGAAAGRKLTSQPPKYVQTISSQARRLHRGNKGAVSVDAAAKDLQVPAHTDDALLSTRRGSMRRRRSRRLSANTPSAGGSSEGRQLSSQDASRLDSMENELRQLRREMRIMMSEGMEKLQSLVKESIAATDAEKLKKKKKSKEKKAADSDE